ncbi:MAG TPA: hypothetical protein DET40_24390 [Lentisphaeria bacterium]|nr:MAG: hypothetical protein A2X45_00145 [Lentisphaerae bacterium GWF2_50_93]HCE46699.1 hypothetical protein [Lentisphaeria bacterium]
MKRAPVRWTKEYTDALKAAKAHMKSARKIASHTGIHESQIGKFLKKTDGWVDKDTFERLCRLKEFKKLSASVGAGVENMTDNEKILLKLFRKLPTDIQKEKLLELMKMVTL